ncbi:MAG: type II secretion system protein [Vicinamibacterales bacterium]
MVALLVSMSVMAILMSVALPAWHTIMRREKEAELVFRGEQYARAISLWQRRFANASPPSIDVLVEQRLLRKKYKDPITNDDFQILAGGAPTAGQTQQTTVPLQGGGRASAPVGVPQGRGNVVGGGIVGVTSKSPEKSLRLYNGRDTYNQWVFMPVARTTRAEGGRGTDNRAGPRGGPSGEGRGGRGRGRGLPPSSDGDRGGRGVEGMPQGRF